MAYVLEGSALGARFIAERLKREAPGLLRQYFDAAARDAAERWPEFWRLADSALGVADYPRATEAACTRLGSLREYLGRATPAA